MFFNPFPKINYELEDDNQIRVVNIVTTNMVKHWVVDKLYVYEQYEAIGTESLEAISYKLYGRSDYFWTIMVVNGMINPFNLWFGNNLINYCERKYGDPYDVHHFEDVRTNKLVDDFDADKYRKMNPYDIPTWIQRVTNIEFEEKEVAKRRSFYVISKRHILKFVEDYRQSIKGV